MSGENRFFQFIRGERKGEVVMFDEIIQEDGLIFVQFKDKSRCNEELILPLNEREVNSSHVMAEVSDANNIWKFEEEWVGKTEEVKAENADGAQVIITPATEGKKRIKIIPPRKVNSNFGRIQKIIETPKPKVDEAIQKPIDPVYSMMEAAKKFPTLVNMEMEILLPKKSLFDVANESFENGGQKVLEYIIENLDISKLKDALRKSLYESYKEPNEVKEPHITKEDLNFSSFEPDMEEAPFIGEPIPAETLEEIK